MGESCAGCIELPKYRRFLLFPLYRLVTLQRAHFFLDLKNQLNTRCTTCVIDVFEKIFLTSNWRKFLRLLYKKI
jgi:hypothetical protein